jgi:hypothetical protein
MIPLVSLFFALFMLLACKPQKAQESSENSITLKGSAAGKWLATVAIGGGVSAKDTLYLANVLKQTFGSVEGGNYQRGFHIDDKSGIKPTKSFVIEQFARLKSSIRSYKEKNPGAPTMLVLGLTGHGFGRAALSEYSNDEYIFVVNNEAENYTNPNDVFTGRELVQQIANLEVDEALVFVQSCLSGDFAKVSFLNQYGRHLSQEANRLNVNIAVITPVHELLFSPVNGIEPMIAASFKELHSGTGDFVTYAMFKDALMRRVCESDKFMPRSAFLDASAVGPSAMAGRADLASGIEPQFFESISPNLPLLLTREGVRKFNDRTLVLPPQSAKSRSVPLSKATLEVCERSKQKNKIKFSALENERVRYKNIYLKCQSEKDPETCLEKSF